MSLRIGFDLDGTLADLSSIYHEYEQSIFGEASDALENNENETDDEQSNKEKLKLARAASNRRDSVWRALRNTPDFWTLLKPIEPGTIRELYEATLANGWEVFFITQRPKTAGASVQLQSQRWLVENGFAMPSVLTLSGSRGKAAHALDLDFLVDDLPKNCVDVISDSRCRPILVMRNPDSAAELTAKRMNIGLVRSASEAIAFLKQPAPQPRASMVASILQRLGLAR